jgi:hypothetical protein
MVSFGKSLNCFEYFSKKKRICNKKKIHNEWHNLPKKSLGPSFLKTILNFG